MIERPGCTPKNGKLFQMIQGIGNEYCWVGCGNSIDPEESVSFVDTLPSNELKGDVFKYYMWGSPEALRIIVMGGIA
jgi:hypothetical protein